MATKKDKECLRDKYGSCIKDRDPFESPLNIPVGRAGKWDVEHKTIPAWKEVTVVSMRTAIFKGVRPQSVCYSAPKTFHFLKKDGQTVMSDIPQEQFDFQDVVEHCDGRVLVGGLGLGYITKKLDEKESVKEIVVVEKDQNVIKLVWNHLGAKKARIVKGDLFKFLEKNKEKYDCAVMDIWNRDSEANLYEYVVPLRKLALPYVPKDKIFSWKEDVMRGQLSMNLQTQVGMSYDALMMMPEKDFNTFYGKWDRPMYAILNWMRSKKVPQRKVLSEVENYALTWGDPEWDRRWKQYNIKSRK